MRFGIDDPRMADEAGRIEFGLAGTRPGGGVMGEARSGES